MFSLAYPLTETVEVDGQTYPLDMSFDNVLRLIEMLSDQELSDVLQVETGIQMLLGDVEWDLQRKSDILNAIFAEAIMQHSVEAQEVDIKGNPMPSKQGNEKPKYSLVEDAEYIYSSFMYCYRMDLCEQQGELHWDKFKALLGGLSDDCIFRQIIDIRTRKLPTGKGTSEERSNLIKLKKQYALKGTVIDEVEDESN